MTSERDYANKSGTASGSSCGVMVLFGEPAINELFSQLLRARGVNTEIAANISKLNLASRIITEPQYFGQLPQELRKNCLVVGNKDTLRDIEALSLSRPLTEEKIELALAKFLA